MNEADVQALFSEADNDSSGYLDARELAMAWKSAMGASFSQ
jgi:Ca2+-binding EF-hand superfamily protein